MRKTGKERAVVLISLIFFSVFFLFLGMLVWPIGLHNDKLPCDSRVVEPEVYHLCDPWEAGWGALGLATALISLA